MVIKLYWMAPSPPSRMVAMTLKALNLEYEEKLIDLHKDDHKTPEYLAINPRGKVPSLSDGEFVITESRAIATYLCNKYEKGDDSKRFYPTDPETRGLVDQILYVSENVNDAVQAYVNLGGVCFGNETQKDENLPKVRSSLEICEKYLEKNTYMAGDHVTLADFFMVMPMLMVPLPGFDEFCNYPKTKTWMDKIMGLKAFVDSNTEGKAIIDEWYQRCLKNNQSK